MNSFVRFILLSVGMLALSMTSNVYSYSSIAKGLGTKTDPIQITTCQQLQDISQNLSADYVLDNDIDCSDSKNWNAGAGFLPIDGFSGTLDGKNYYVRNIFIDRPTNTAVGVFATSIGTLDNINFSNENITGLSSRTPDPSYMGGVVAFNKGTMTGVSAEGEYSGNAVWNGVLIGENSGKVSNCGGHGKIFGSDNTAGLIGYQFTTGSVLNSYSDAMVTGATSSYLNSDFDGGLVGSNDGIIQGCYATGNVTGLGTYAQSTYAGGLVAWNQENGRISDSYSGSITSSANAGGLVGIGSLSCVLTNDYSFGKVTGTITAGGLLDKNDRGVRVVNSYYDTDTSGQSDTGKGTPVHTAQMYQQATFSGWDFANTWTIDEGKAYPKLNWEQGDGYQGLDALKTALRTYDSQSSYFKDYGYFDGNTYALGIGNEVRVIQTPSIWGKDLSQVHYFDWDGKDVDFGGLPDCTNSPDVCTPTNTPCTHLNAFYNGITGQATKRCLGPADSMVDDIYNAMIQAHTSIDITTLEPFPDGRFLAAMRNAITWLAVNDRKVTIRVLGGVDYGLGSDEDKLSHEQLHAKYSVNDENFLKALIRDIPADKAANITLYVGSMRSCGSALPSSCVSKESSGATVYRFSWNHSKIIDVDGTISIVGGHNWWTNSYLTRNPISDLSVEVQGPASRNAEPFVDSLWGFICKDGNGSPNTIATSQSWITGAFGDQCLSHLSLPTTTPSLGSTAVLGIGRLGLGMFKVPLVGSGDEPADQSEIARNQMFSQAKTTIRIAQQNLQGLVPAVPGWIGKITGNGLERDNAAGNVYDKLAKFLINNGNLFVVTTNKGAVDVSGGDYYTNTELGNFADTIKNRVIALAPTMPIATVNSLLCNALHLATIQPSTTKTWPDGSVFGNHSKVWITDDEDYYVGSHNIYAANLQEYGYIVGGKTATDDFIAQYWNPLWQYSSAAAISGSEVPSAQCYFNTKHLNTIKCTGRTVISDDKVQYTGCTDSNDDAPITFATSTSMPIDPDETECETYQPGTNQDNWTGCGQAELGSQDYTITW